MIVCDLFSMFWSRYRPRSQWFFFFQAEDGILDIGVTGVQTCALPIVAEVKLDFGVLERLSAVCRSYGLAGAVQHGASTLPDELFHRFPQVETAEIHLATGFQRSEGRRVGKEGRSRWSPYHYKKQTRAV